MKLTEKEKRKLAAIVIFKCIERELNTLREKGNVTCPESDSEIVDAIAGNINAWRGQWRKTRPEGVASACLYDALRFRTDRLPSLGGVMLTSIRHGADVSDSIRHGADVSDAYDTIAYLLVRNRERISEMAKHALNKGN